MRSILFAVAMLMFGSANAQLYVNEPFPKAITPFFERMSNSINTNGPIYINVRPCGVQNAFWNNQSEITVCQELYENILNKQVSPDNPSAKMINTTVVGQLVFVILHELGHALIDRHRIPFSGREEDTSDQFAAYIIMKLNSVQAYLGATNFFAEPSRMLNIFGKRQLTDEHGLNVQRRAQLVCWGYGRDARSMQVFAQHIGLTQNRLQRCPEEYQQLMQNTPRLFAAAWKQQQSQTPNW